jgi:zinc protease
VRVALTATLLSLLACEEAPRFASWDVVRAPHPAWSSEAAGPEPAAADDFRAYPPTGTAAALPELPVISETTLPSGVRVLVLERHSLPLASIGIVVARGAAQAPAGVAEMAARMLFEDTTRIEGDRLKQDLSEMGAEWNTSALYDAVTIDAKLPATNAGGALRVLTEVLRSPTFPEEHFEVMKSQLIASLDHDATSPKGASEEALETLLYPVGQPYREPGGGDPEAVQRVRRDDLVAFWRASAVPSLTTYVVAGDVDGSAVVTELGTLVGDWSGSGSARMPLPDAGLPTGPRTVVLDHPGDPQAVVRIGWLGPDRDSPDIPKLRTLAATLGHDASGRVGSLYRALRIERGETYGVNASIVPRLGASELVIETAVERDGAGDALRAIFAAIDRIRTKPVDEVALLGTQDILRVREWKALETCSDVVAALTPVAAYREPLDTFFAELHGTTSSREEIQAVAKRYLGEPSRALVVVGDAVQLRPALEAAGLRDVAVRPLAAAR